MEKIDLSFLPENTRMVFDKLEERKLVQNFVLVGETALALQAQHRQSEDLDFIFDGRNLPLTKIK